MTMFGVNCNFDILKYLYFYLHNPRRFNENVFLIYLHLNPFKNQAMYGVRIFYNMQNVTKCL